MRFLLIAAVVALVGCSERAQSPDVASDSIELTYWPAPNPEEIRLADTLVKAWNRLHPGVQVKMQPIPVSQSTEEVLLAAIAGKTTPDVCSNILPGALRDYTSAGGLISLDQFPDFDSVALSRSPKDVLESFRTDGHFYQIPWKTNPVMMFYNMRLLEEGNVKQLPRTYSEYLAAGKTVTRDIDGDGQTDVWMGERDIRPIWWQRLFDFFPFYIAASGGKTLFENDKVAFANASSETVFRFFQECYSRGYFPKTYFQGGDPFLLEKKASHISGPWELATLQKFNPQMRFEIAPIPVPDDYHGPVYTFGNYKNIAMFSTTRHPKEAWEFIKFLISPEHDLQLLEICNQLPIRSDLTTNPLFAGYFRNNPKMTKFAEQARFTREMDAAPDLKEIFDAIAQEYEVCCVYGKKSPAEAVRNAATQTQLIVDWNK